MFGLGDVVKVKLAGVNMDLLKIDFGLQAKLHASKMNQTKKDHSNSSQPNRSSTSKDQPKKSPAKRSGSRGGRGSSKKS